MDAGLKKQLTYGLLLLVILVTHDPEEADYLADTRMILPSPAKLTMPSRAEKMSLLPKLLLRPVS